MKGACSIIYGCKLAELLPAGFFYDFRGASILIASPIWTVLISSLVKIGDVRLANYESPVPLCKVSVLLGRTLVH